ncbi:MAG: hypothetical protein QW404_03325 [Candidatus Nanoarchaeia archaeon]
MPIVGFSFDKIFAEKSKPIEGQVSVKRDLAIKSIKKEEVELGPKRTEDLLRCDFEFSVKYEPSVGIVTIDGHILYREEAPDLKKILDNWKKNKSLPAGLTTLLLNAVLIRCNIRALSLTQEVGLPPHLQLPTVSPKSKASDYIG